MAYVIVDFGVGGEPVGYGNTLANINGVLQAGAATIPVPVPVSALW